MTASFSDYLDHHGTKGMKWGVRKDGSSGPKPTKADKQWQKNIYSIHGAVAIHNEVANRMNYGGLEKLNAKHAKSLKIANGNEDHPLWKKYIKDYEKMSEEFTAKAVNDIHGTSPSGGYKATLDTSNPQQWAVKVSPVEVRHAMNDIPALIMEVEHDEMGMITAVKYVKEVLAQDGISSFDDFLEHYGKKGMRWGVRKNPVKTSSDFRKTAPHRGKKPHQLTDKQLKDVNARLNLEQNYKRLNPSKAQKGEALAKNVIRTAALVGSLAALMNSAGGKSAIAAGKKAVSRSASIGVARRVLRPSLG